MALHKDFPQSPHAILDPGIRWFPADEALRESSMEKLMPPLVAELRRKVGRKLGERKGDIEKRGQIFFIDPLIGICLWGSDRGNGTWRSFSLTVRILFPFSSRRFNIEGKANDIASSHSLAAFSNQYRY